MSENILDRKVFTLLEVTRSVQNTLQERYSSAFWVKAEMNKLNFYRQSGHCYPELVEKSEGRVIAQIRSVLWRTDYQRINASFQSLLHEPLKDGIKILFQAKITFDPVYGISLTILDIDPGFTLGDLEKEKQEAIRQLTEEGIFKKNKSLPFPLLPQRIAIISVETSKGYADFIKVIDHNPWHYKFTHRLYPSLLQGDNAVNQIIAQLKKIEKTKQRFDLVAIIRGGGGDVGLSCYNNYSLAREVANFPIPVLTGIGHATNETVCEMVAYMNAITPTQLADTLLQKFQDFAMPVQKAQAIITDKATRIIAEEKARMRSEIKLFNSATSKIFLGMHSTLRQLSTGLIHASKNQVGDGKEALTSIEREAVTAARFHFQQASQRLSHISLSLSATTTNRLMGQGYSISRQEGILYSTAKQKLKSDGIQLENLEKNLLNMSPENVLKRGYSITRLNGRAVKYAKELKPGDAIETLLLEGSVSSTITSTTPTKES